MHIVCMYVCVYIHICINREGEMYARHSIYMLRTGRCGVTVVWYCVDEGMMYTVSEDY